MPEPISLLLLGGAKLFAMHTAHAAAAHAVVGGTATAAGGTAAGAHTAAWVLVGVGAGTTLLAICVCLKKLVEHGVFSDKQAKAYKEKAMKSKPKVQKAMLKDAEALCEKYGCN